MAAACRLYDAFDRKAELYAGNPLLGEVWSDLEEEVRAFRVGRYLALYQPIENGIEVLRILHTARDILGVRLFVKLPLFRFVRWRYASGCEHSSKLDRCARSPFSLPC